MKKFFCYLLIMEFLIIAGCTSTHYVRIRSEKAYLYLEYENATTVLFLSSLDGYRLHRASKVNDATWVITVPSDRVFRYFYIIDGVVYIPDSKWKECDDFGSVNSLFVPDM